MPCNTPPTDDLEIPPGPCEILPVCEGRTRASAQPLAVAQIAKLQIKGTLPL